MYLAVHLFPFSHPFQARTCSLSQLHQASTPSPVLAEMGNILSFGLRMCAYSTTLSMSKSKYGSTSILLMMSASQHSEDERVFERLVVPLRHGEDHRVFDRAGVELRRADEIADVLEHDEVQVLRADLLAGPARVMPASRWHMPPVCSWMDLDARRPRWCFASTSESMSASITPMRSSSLQRFQRAQQRRRLAAAGRGHQVQQKRSCPACSSHAKAVRPHGRCRRRRSLSPR